MDAKHATASRWSKLLPFAVWLPLLACFAIIQIGTDRFGGNDGYYHIKYAWLLWHEGAIWDFPWLRGTFFHERWVDSEFLYHVLLIPFTLPGDLYLAGKVAPAFWGSVAIFSVYWVIRDFGAVGSAWRKYAWWSVFVLMAASFVALYRLSMPRVPAASLTFMMVGLLLLERRLWKWLAVLGFFYAWMYPVSVVLIPLALFHAVGRWYDTDKWSWRPVVAAAGGVTAGFIFNPYFPNTLPILFNHVVEIGMGTSDIPKGNEWTPYDSWFLFRNAIVAWIALFLGGLAMIGAPARGRHIAMLAATAMMMLAYFKSRRFVEYWPFFAVLFAASTFHDALKARDSLVSRVRRALGGFEPVLVMCVTILLIGVTIKNVRRATKDVGSNAMPTRLAGATAWLRENTPAGSQVYNVEWDIFPELIFYNHHNHWTMGLDPNFTNEVDPKLYHTAVAIALGYLAEPGFFIKKYFGAEYALATSKTTFVKKARSPRTGLEEVYSDEHAAVFKITPTYRTRTLEAELEPYTTDLSDDVGHCRYRSEDAKVGVNSYFLQCRLKKAQPFVLRYRVDMPHDGLYSVMTRLLRGGAGGRVEIFVDGDRMGDPVSLSDDERGFKSWVPLGRLPLKRGDVSVEVRFYPEHPAARPDDAESGKPKKWPIEVGLDSVRFSRVR